MINLLDKCIENIRWFFGDDGVISNEIITSTPISTKRGMFRPSTFSEYIGQEKIKEIITRYMLGIKQRNKTFPHILISGPPGFGKTTLAQVIAKELSVPFKSTIGSSISNLKDLFSGILNVKDSILFVDEIHALDRNIVEQVYTLMEDFKIGEIDITPFTIIGATTELGEILKDRRPFYDRFKIILELENYQTEDLETIAKQYKEKEFTNENLNKSSYSILARNCRNTPRAVLRLLEATIYFEGDVKKVLSSFNIIKNGYTYKDLSILKYLLENIKGVGLQGLCSYLNIPTETYLYEIEPYLLTNGLLVRTARGRKITNNGIKTIKELYEELNPPYKSNV